MLICFKFIKLYPICLDVNTSRVDNIPLPETQYKHGLGDILNVIFYSLIWIIIHALVQEYIWEVSRVCVYYLSP